MSDEGIPTETFDIGAGTFYYIPAMLLHEFIDRVVSDDKAASGTKSQLGGAKGNKRKKQVSPTRGIHKGKKAKNTASSEQSEAEGNKRKQQVPPTRDTHIGKKAKNTTAHGQSETCCTKLPAYEQILESRWELVCASQDEWAGAAFRSQYNVGENVGVKKHVMLAKLARVCSGTPYSAQLPGSAYDQLDPPGTNKEWNSPQIQVHDTRLYITHVESVSEDPSVSSLRQ
jgi:hypothetical protein